MKIEAKKQQQLDEAIEKIVNGSTRRTNEPIVNEENRFDTLFKKAEKLIFKLKNA